MNSTGYFIVQPFGYAQEGTTQPRHLEQTTIITTFCTILRTPVSTCLSTWKSQCASRAYS